MNNFQFKNPTKILFGKNQIEPLSKEIPKNSKVLLLYGGGSIFKNNVYDQVIKALKGFEIVEFGGIPANPEYEILMKAVELIQKENITFLLAVGGGSVIDGTKFIAAASLYEGENPWEMLTKGISVKNAMPFGTVLTLPATGSEMNSGTVITRKATQEKFAMRSDLLFPQFSILDPGVIHSIPQNQIANGIVDAFTHVLEQYMTYPVDAKIQDRMAEGVMQTLIEIAPSIMKNPSDYDAAANFMWSCTMALNGVISVGVPSDWAIHMIGHELTALYGIDHAQTLAIITESHYRYNLETKKEKLAQYAERVWNIQHGSIEEKALAGIEKTTLFFKSLGIKTKLSDYTTDYKKTAQFISKRFTERGWLGMGEHGKLTPQDVEKIVEMSY